MIDVTFKVDSDSNGKDPDLFSPTLKSYHKFLWSKELPCGKLFSLSEEQNSYLVFQDRHKKLYLGSDAITHSYQNQKRKQAIIQKIPEEVEELRELGLTIGAYTLFPNKQVNRKFTINQARGVSRIIDDRFDLTLECIRRHYLSIRNPLQEVLLRYGNFFELFNDFRGYSEFFLLQDLLNDDDTVRFHLPFDDFNSKHDFKNIETYLKYKENIQRFIESRNHRILSYCRLKEIDG